jgi:hypothetical protein
MPRSLTIEEINALQNIARNTSGTRGAFATLDVSCFATVGGCADYSRDVDVLSWDTANDTDDTAKSRAAKRRAILGGIQRTARKVHANDKITLTAYFADYAVPVIDNDGNAETLDDGTPVVVTERVYMVTRTA